MSAVQLGPPRVSILNLTLWGSRTSIEDGNAGQLELPASTTANFAPLSSQPAEGKGYARSRAEESVFAVTASAGRPPWCSDSAIEAGVVEHAVSSADMHTIQIQMIFPMCRGYLAGSGSSLPATVREASQSYGNHGVPCRVFKCDPWGGRVLNLDEFPVCEIHEGCSWHTLFLVEVAAVSCSPAIEVHGLQLRGGVGTISGGGIRVGKVDVHVAVVQAVSVNQTRIRVVLRWPYPHGRYIMQQHQLRPRIFLMQRENRKNRHITGRFFPLKSHQPEEAPWFPERSNQYKCLSWPGVHRSRPARNTPCPAAGQAADPHITLQYKVRHGRLRRPGRGSTSPPTNMT
jgi:hypothetical protein